MLNWKESFEFYSNRVQDWCNEHPYVSFTILVALILVGMALVSQ